MSAQPATPQPLVFVIGDIHGEYEKLVDLLRGAGLIDGTLAWSAADATLWFMGDFFDRGPDGIAVIDLVRRLQREAPALGGAVGALLGNHEPLLLGAQRFGHRRTTWGGTFLSDWEINGGQLNDYARLTAERVAWITSLPAMAHAAGRLLMHADATFYNEYGQSIDAVNQAVHSVLAGDDSSQWDRLLEQFSDRGVFADAPPDQPDPIAQQFLDRYGGRQIIHGHTPISKQLGQPPHTITSALVYAGGLCVNVDGALTAGGPGFVYEIGEP
jgi:hypothetical protein